MVEIEGGTEVITCLQPKNVQYPKPKVKKKRIVEARMKIKKAMESKKKKKKKQ